MLFYTKITPNGYILDILTDDKLHIVSKHVSIKC